MTKMKTTAVGPSVYVASLSDYNGGYLHGVWIDMTQGIAEVWEQVEAMLTSSPHTKKYGDKAEEWAIHDYEGFGSIRVSEHCQILTLSFLALAIEEHGEAFTIWYEDFDGASYDQDCWSESFQEQYMGSWPTKEGFAEEYADMQGYTDIIDDSPLAGYIDWEGYARELEAGGMYFVRVKDGSYYVFNSY